MRIFILFFFLTYGLLHLYVFYRAKAATGFGPSAGVLLFIFMACMVIAPAAIRFSERHGFDAFAHALSYIGYFWLGLLFLFFSLSLVTDLVRGTLYLFGLMFKKDLSAFWLSQQASFYLSLCLAAGVAVYGYFEALSIRTEHVQIRSAKIPEDPGRVRVVQISDVHLGLIVRQDRLKRILHAVRESSPDILVSTGDLVDGQINRMEGLAELFQEVRPQHGKYAITGNHEYYAGLDQAIAFTERAGFSVLRGEARDVSDLITIAGVDDPAGKYYGLSAEKQEKDLLSSLPQGKFVLFLKHRPFVASESLGRFDLQLSGHTHKGQIFPFSLATWIYYPQHAGCLIPLDGCYLYVSRGSGTWGPPIRFLSPPEVTVIDLIHDKAP